jgi:hypothetical protein
VLRDTALAQIASGHPMKKLRLAKPALDSIAEYLEWLRERVETVEETVSQNSDVVVSWPDDDWT